MNSVFLMMNQKLLKQRYADKEAQKKAASQLAAASADAGGSTAATSLAVVNKASSDQRRVVCSYKAHSAFPTVSLEQVKKRT